MLMQLTGSAKITTWTVALPGVSRLTRGVKIVFPVSLAFFSISGSSLLEHENAILPKADAKSTGPSNCTKFRVHCWKTCFQNYFIGIKLK